MTSLNNRVTVQLSEVEYPRIGLLHYHLYYHPLSLKMFLDYQAK